MYVCEWEYSPNPLLVLSMSYLHHLPPKPKYFLNGSDCSNEIIPGNLKTMEFYFSEGLIHVPDTRHLLEDLKLFALATLP